MSEVIIALDFPGSKDTLDFLDGFHEPVFVKVGMELFYKEGPQIIKEIKERKHKIFLDLKLHDIPNTVEQAMKSLRSLGVDMVNVHCAGGLDMMKAAIRGLLDDEGNRPICIGVTQLTSTSQEVMNKELGIQGNLADCVIKYGANAKKAGLDGVVCSVHESRFIHDNCGSDFLTVTPGIRMLEDSSHDQKRVATPELARKEGSDFIVVGRSITKSDEPYNTYLKIRKLFQGK